MALAVSPLSVGLETDLGLKWLFAVRGTVQAPADAVVVDVGERSLRRLTLSSNSLERLSCPHRAQERRRETWSRCLYARLIEALVRRGASVIVFDVAFLAPGDVKEDLALARTVETADRIVLLQKMELEYVQAAKVRLETLSNPFPAMAEAAIGMGPFPLPKVPARVDQFWSFTSSLGNAPTLPAVALQAYTRPALGVLEAAFKRAEVPVGANFLDAPLADVAREDLVAFMKSLRQDMKGRPDIAGRVRAVLEKEPREDRVVQPRRFAQALLGLYSGGDSWYLNYYGPAGTIPIIPADKILNSSATADSEQDAIAGKVVFVGAAGQGRVRHGDDFQTVFSQENGIDLGGAEIAATAFLNLLTSRPLIPLNNLSAAAVIGLFGSLVVLITYAFPVSRGIVAVSVLSASYILLTYILFAQHAIWLPIVVPLAFQLPIGVSAGLFLHYRKERISRDMAYDAIRQYLPREAADALIKHGEIGATPITIYGICLTTDIEHFTTLAEKMDAGSLAHLLNEYLEPVTQSVVRHGGSIMEIVADSLMCVWREEPRDADIRRRACLAAIDLDLAVAGFNALNPTYRMPTRIGLHAGELAIGNVGGAGRLAYAVIGDSANTASRIEGLSKHLGTRILASDTVMAGLDDVPSRRVGVYRFVGKAMPVSIFEILGQDHGENDRRERLCRSFAEALATFEAARWREALRYFEAHLAAYPDDAPARFLLTLCRDYCAKPPAVAEPWIIQMRSK